MLPLKLSMFMLIIGAYGISNHTSDLIMGFLKAHNSKFCYLLVCWSNRDKLETYKVISKQLDLSVAYLPVKEGSIFVVHKSYAKVSYILDLSCGKKDAILQEVSDTNKFRNIHNWLMIGSPRMVKNDIEKMLDNIELRMDTDITIALFKPENNRYDIFEIYNPGLEADLKINIIGNFEDGNLTYFNKNVSYYESRKNMTGVLVRAANRANYSFNSVEDYVKELRHKEVDTFQKYDFQLFLRLIEIHGFRYNTTLRSWWFGNSTIGIEGGISQLLYENTVDISSSGGILRAGRMPIYDHYVPSYKFRACFFFLNPGIVETGTEVLKPFTLNTWYVTVSSIILMGVAIKTAYWVENRFLRSPSRYSLFTSIVITISVFAQQGSAIFPNHLGGRTIFLTLLILSIVLYNYYTSSLVSSLLSTQPPVIHTLKQLYESDLKVGIEYQPYTLTYIFQEKNNYYIQKLNSNKIYEPRRSRPNFFPPKDGLTKVKEGGFAYHTEVATAYPIISRTFDQGPICDLAEIDLLTPGFVSFMAPKNSQYKELFQISLVKMMQTGIFNREERVWVERPPKCLSNLRVISVGANALFMAYMILVVGVVLAMIILVIEIVWYKVEMRKIVGYAD